MPSRIYKVYRPVDTAEWLELFKPGFTKEQLIDKLRTLMAKHNFRLDMFIKLSPPLARGKKLKLDFVTLTNYAALAENPTLISAIIDLRMEEAAKESRLTSFINMLDNCWIRNRLHKYDDIIRSYLAFTVRMDMDDFELRGVKTIVNVECVAALLQMPCVKQEEEQSGKGLHMALEGSDVLLLNCLLQNCNYPIKQYVTAFHYLMGEPQYRPERTIEFTVESRRRLWLDNMPKSCYGIEIIELLRNVINGASIIAPWDKTYVVTLTFLEKTQFQSKLEEISTYIDTLSHRGKAVSKNKFCY